MIEPTAPVNAGVAEFPPPPAFLSSFPSPDDFRISRLRALRGPNFWRLAPVIACDVHLGALEHVPSIDMPGFPDRLVQAIPTLSEHAC
ncbi:MAG: hypothetical protein ACR2M1_02425, partial [Gemmatimonadaceae bacterium]